MQSINNLSPRGRQLLIGAITICILLPMFYLLYTASSNSDPNKKGRYYDKNSGLTVTNNNQTPETFGTENDQPTYLGTINLFDIGVTRYQLAATEKALFDFSKTVTDKPSEISVDVKSIESGSYNPEETNPVSNATFIFQLDRKAKYKVKLQYSGISSAKISVETLKGEVLYTSKEIDGSKLDSNE